MKYDHIKLLVDYIYWRIKARSIKVHMTRKVHKMHKMHFSKLKTYLHQLKM